MRTADPPTPPTSLDPYLEYLRLRREEGKHSAKVLHQELVTKGYCGHYQRVKMAVAACRSTPRASVRPRPGKPPAVDAGRPTA
ncbi:hypothetical protein [Streptomyces sp. NPDC058579]|uniref:hypothetical protein n=1 Tax=Streptomyces sp. NPDC058579 TaxID=3346548 RepID=UPI00365A1DB8